MSPQSASLLLVLLLGADFTFLGIHITHIMKILDSQLFSLGADWGYAKVFQYIKYFWIVILLVYIFRKTKISGYLSWAAVFSYFLIDDAFEIHETCGRFIGGYLEASFSFQVPLNLRFQDLGELSSCAISGSFLLIILSWGYLSGPAHFKNTSKDILLLLGILVFFGVFMDMVGVAMKSHVHGLGLLEDGGEMLTVSLILWYVFQLAVRNERENLYLHNIFRRPALDSSLKEGVPQN